MARKINISWIVVWSFVGVVASIVFLNDYWIKNKKKAIDEIVETSYDINGVNYPSYSQLKYIALNELSFDEVPMILARCGMSKEPSPSGSSVNYYGSCGKLYLQILDRSNNDEFVIYSYHLPSNKEYSKMLRTEIMGESNIEEGEFFLTATINDYWFVTLSHDSSNLHFQRFQSKKLPK